MATIRIRNLPTAYEEEKLLRLCSSFGEITGIRVVRPGDRYRGRTDGVAVDVSFEEHEDAQSAVANIEGMEFGGSFLRTFVMT